MLDYISAHEKLKKISQEHLFHFWDSLSFKEKETLLIQVTNLDCDLFLKQQSLVLQPLPSKVEQIDPYDDFTETATLQREIAENGKTLLAKGKIGCVVMAGGQGTRLGFEGPKGIYPVTLIKHKSLFQLVSEKSIAASKQVNYPLPLAIMTSPDNDDQTQAFFTENRNFGLEDSNLSFFSQGMLPLLDKRGNLFLEEKGKIAEGPDGNGSFFKHFKESVICKNWKERGIQYVTVVPIDNPLADPFDHLLIGFHQHANVDVTIKSILRNSPDENVGVIVNKNGRKKPTVIEYTELSSHERSERMASTGKLKHACANISLFCFDIDFLSSTAYQEYPQMPLHPSWKKAVFLSEEGIRTKSVEPMAWKFERFIFDILPFTPHIATLVYPREHCFAPLKNAIGMDSIHTVQQALLHHDAHIFNKINGIPSSIPSTHTFELAPDFYYPTPDLLTKWKGRPFPSTQYIQ